MCSDDVDKLARYACTCGFCGCEKWRLFTNKQIHNAGCDVVLEGRHWSEFLFWHEGDPLTPTAERISDGKLRPDYDAGAVEASSTSAFPTRCNGCSTLTLPARRPALTLTPLELQRSRRSKEKAKRRRLAEAAAASTDAGPPPAPPPAAAEVSARRKIAPHTVLSVPGHVDR